GAFMYNEQGKYVAAAYSAVADRAAVFATMEIAVNLLSLFFQAVVVGWLTRRGSVAWSLSAMPLLLGASFILLATHLLFRARWILPTAELVLAGALALVSAYVYNFFTSEKRRRVRDKAIELFVGALRGVG
ncbi:hypothetical protein B4Q13_21560, partial [Lacticaseibacillus rhamnosus]